MVVGLSDNNSYSYQGSRWGGPEVHQSSPINKNKQNNHNQSKQKPNRKQTKICFFYMLQCKSLFLSLHYDHRNKVPIPSPISSSVIYPAPTLTLWNADLMNQQLLSAAVIPLNLSKWLLLIVATLRKCMPHQVWCQLACCCLLGLALYLKVSQNSNVQNACKNSDWGKSITVL